MTDVRSRRALRIAVYACLVASAAATFVLGDDLWSSARQGDLPIWLPLAAPTIFTVFVVVYTLDRWLLVRRRVSSMGRAAIQVAFALIFLSLLWPPQATQYRQLLRDRDTGDYALPLLLAPEASVRAAACELLGLRAQRSAESRIRNLATNDDSARVRGVCRNALARLGAALAERTP